MCLGALVTIAQNPPENFTMGITENSTYEVIGGLPIPGAAHVNFEALARGAGFAHVYTIDNASDFNALLPLHFEGKGCRVFIWKIRAAQEPVPKPRLYIRERAWILKRALADKKESGF